jgi:hypothetical protein
MEMLFVHLLAMMTVFYAFRYVWVHIQCRRAIGYAGYLSEKHIYDCADAFTSISESHIMDEQKEILRGYVRKALNHAQDYFDEGYNKDFDFNKLWLDPYKWSLKQMFPTLTNMKGLEITYE